MKRLNIALIALLFSTSIISNAHADHNATNGVIIGAGSGAILGQAIGQDTEATLIGTAVGGLFGYMIGNEMDRNGNRVVHHRTYQPPRTYSHKVINTGRPFAPKYKNRYRNADKVCKKTIKIKERHGRTKKVVTKTCWYEDSYGHRYGKKDHWKRSRNHDRWEY